MYPSLIIVQADLCQFSMTFETIGTDFEGMAGGGTAQGFFTNSPPPTENCTRRHNRAPPGWQLNTKPDESLIVTQTYSNLKLVQADLCQFSMD